jgi:WD40 repeat protein
MRFGGPQDPSGPAVFVLSPPEGRRFSLVGYLHGLLRLLNIESLRLEGGFRLPLRAEEEEQISSGAFNPNGINFAVGTTSGSIFFGSLREDA